MEGQLNLLAVEGAGDPRGTRGGSTGSFDEGAARMEQARPVESAQLRRLILRLAVQFGGEFHGDMLTRVVLSQRNMIGAQVSGLVRCGYLEPTGQRRRSVNPASHGRKSEVYRLTAKGREAARA